MKLRPVFAITIFASGTLLFQSILPARSQTPLQMCQSIVDPVLRTNCLNNLKGATKPAATTPSVLPPPPPRHTPPLAAKQDAVDAESSSTHWRLNIWEDKLTGDKEVRFQNRALNDFVQFGRHVDASLLLHCMKSGSDPAYPRVIMFFSERVGLSDIRIRYRFDKQKVNGPYKYDLYSGGELVLLEPDLDEVKPSSTLGMELELPWAKGVLLNFDVRGTAQALKKLSCAR